MGVPEYLDSLNIGVNRGGGYGGGGGGAGMRESAGKPISQLAVSLRNIIHYTRGRKGQSDRSAVGRRAG